MKALLRPLVPRFMREAYARRRRQRIQQANEDRTPEEVFTAIYQSNAWGGVPGEFYSGSGTADAHIASAYLTAISALAQRETFMGSRFVDLGCGDFQIGRQLLALCGSYVGVDIVGPLVQRNNDLYGDARTRFVHLNIIDDELPDGEVCFVRQVLQHLSNQQIQRVLPKLEKYRWVLITEHYPRDNRDIRPNIDKVHGGDIRVYDNSGVYLDQPPFRLPTDALELILEVKGAGLDLDGDPGVIRTFLYRPHAVQARAAAPCAA